MNNRVIAALVLLASAVTPGFGRKSKSPVDPEMAIPSNSKIFVGPMNGLGTYVIAAIQKKKTPLRVISEESDADFILNGVSESSKVGWARTVFMAQIGTDEQASVTLVNKKTGVIVYAYNVHKKSSVRGKQSAAEAIAKHIKEKMQE